MMDRQTNTVQPTENSAIAQSKLGGRWTPCVSAARPAGEPRPTLLGIFPGEGVGAEVIAAAMTVLDALESVRPLGIARRFGGPIGLAAHESGELAPEAANFCADIFRARGALFCGPGGGRFVYDLRKRFDLYCKIVPLKPAKSLLTAGRLKPGVLHGVDILVVRDNSGGIYQGTWGHRVDEREGRIAEQRFSYTEQQVRRIVLAAGRLALGRRGRLHVIVKDGGLPAISDLWRAAAERAAAEVGVEAVCLNADYAAYLLVQEPRSFDVLVTPNMVGDILADLGAVLLGSRGLSVSGNFSPEGLAVYQTGHGAAYDLAGTDRANPAAQILALAMMLRETYELPHEANRIEAALERVWRAGWRTADLFDNGADAEDKLVGTRRMGHLVAEAVRQLSGSQPVED